MGHAGRSGEIHRGPMAASREGARGMSGYGESTASFPNHVACPLQGHSARTCHASIGLRAGLSLPAAWEGTAWPARSCIRRSAQGYFRSRMLLASPYRMQARPHSIKQPGLLGDENITQQDARQVGSTATPRRRLERFDRLGVRAERRAEARRSGEEVFR